MMTIEKLENGTELILTLAGRLDTMTSKQLEREIASLDGKESVILDFAQLEYVSSAGLRVLLAMQKKMNTQGGRMKLTGVQPEVNEVFEITGFSGVLTIE
jgi:anti-sigma B factor antagonist